MSNPSAAQKAPDFLVHEDGDSVGVVVVEGIKAGSDLTGWVMAQDRTISVKVLNDVPIGHKLALSDLDVGAQRRQVRRDNRQDRRPDQKGRARPRSQSQDEEVVVMQKQFFGYRRENGRVGVRNHVVILPLDDLSNAACEAVGNNIKGTMAIPHPYGRLQFGADLDLVF